jgi:hypothetical protein
MHSGAADAQSSQGNKQGTSSGAAQPGHGPAGQGKFFSDGRGHMITNNGAKSLGNQHYHGNQQSFSNILKGNSHVQSLVTKAASHGPKGLQNAVAKGMKQGTTTLTAHQQAQFALHQAFGNQDGPVTNIHGNGIRGPNVGANAGVTHNGATTTYHAQAAANLVSAQGSFHHGPISGQGSFAIGAQALAGASHTWDPKHLNIQVTGHASASVGVNAQGSIGAQGNIHGVHVSGKLTGQASAGAGAYVQGGAVFDPKHGNVSLTGSGGAYAGAQVSATAAVGIGPAHGSVTGHAYAGVGAYVQAGAGIHNGTVDLSFGAGAALGLGAGFNFHVGVDAKPVIHAAETVAKDVGHVAGDVAHGVGNAVGGAEHAVGSAVSSVLSW